MNRFKLLSSGLRVTHYNSSTGLIMAMMTKMMVDGIVPGVYFVISTNTLTVLDTSPC